MHMGMSYLENKFIFGLHTGAAGFAPASSPPTVSNTVAGRLRTGGTPRGEKQGQVASRCGDASLSEPTLSPAINFIADALG